MQFPENAGFILRTVVIKTSQIASSTDKQTDRQTDRQEDRQTIGNIGVVATAVVAVAAEKVSGCSSSKATAVETAMLSSRSLQLIVCRTTTPPPPPRPPSRPPPPPPRWPSG